MIRSTRRWSTQLLGHLGQLGHGYPTVVADAGPRCPPSVPLLDLAIQENIPLVSSALRPIPLDGVFEGVHIAEELEPLPHAAEINSVLGNRLVRPIVSHEQLKALTARALVVRPGDATAQNLGDPQDVHRIFGSAFDCTHEIITEAADR